MPSGIYTVLSGAMAGIEKVETLSHNLANVSTPAFNQFRMVFEAAQAKQNNELTFVQPSMIERDVRPGPLRETGNPLDLALTEGVYMAVDADGKTAYVRGASLALQPDGTLSTDDGHTVLGETEIVKLPPDARDILIAEDGSVSTDGRTVGRLRLTEFTDQQALIQGPRSSYVDGGRAGPQAVSTSQAVITGYREQANVDLIHGMTEMITAQRTYSAMTKFIQTFSHVESRAARELGR
ncbi:MAG: flagellar hook basal-body protein [Myxococcota bacterium]|nr:flagellar hook basal-body protein [Myxococcota bacterium]